MSLRVSDKTLLKNLLERHTKKEVFEAIAKDLTQSDTREAVTYLIEKLKYDIDDTIDLLLDCKSAQEEINGDTIPTYLAKLFDIVRSKFRKKVGSEYDFERYYLPDACRIIDTINDQYLDSDVILGSYDPDMLINYLEDTSEFDDYIDNIKEEVENDKDEENDKWWEEHYAQKYSELLNGGNFLENLSNDDKWKFFCNHARCSYYDKDRLIAYLDNLKSDLMKSSYAREISDKKAKA